MFTKLVTFSPGPRRGARNSSTSGSAPITDSYRYSTSIST